MSDLLQKFRDAAKAGLSIPVSGGSIPAAHVVEIAEGIQAIHAENAQLKAENERLKEALAASGAAAAKKPDEFVDWLLRQLEERSDLKAERDRLRQSLRELLDADTHSDCLPFSGNCPRCVAEEEARAALEGK